MPIETPDVLVVGLGPAGSRAAAMAAAAGLSVVALERRREVGTPVQCAEFVPDPIERDVPGVRAVTAQKIGRMLTFNEPGSPQLTDDFRGLMIDRAAFDRMLAQEAALNGAECRYGEAVLSIDADGTVQTSAGARLRPPVLIGADGPRSQVGAAIGAINRDLVETRQVTVPLVLPHDATDIFLSADYRGGYGWLFPKGAVANVGLGVAAEARPQLKPMLAALLRYAFGGAPYRHAHILPDRRRDTGGRAFAFHRPSRRYARAARRRCRRSHQSGHRRRHRFGGAVGRARRAGGGGFARRPRRCARRLRGRARRHFRCCAWPRAASASRSCLRATQTAAGPTRAR